MSESGVAAMPSTPRLRDDLMAAERVGLMLYAARAVIELEIAEHLANGPLTVEELASRANAHAPSLFRLLRALESVGAFKQVSPRVFANTADSEILRKGTPGSVWTSTRATFGCGFAEAYLSLPNSVRTGRTAFEIAHGCNLWEFLRRDPDREMLFGYFMDAFQAAMTPAVTAAYDWGRFPVIADVGGGIGTQLVDILRAYPSCNGILFDQPDVVARAIAQDRMERVAGNFFERVPTGADAYILRFVIHDWLDSRAIAILKNVREAVKRDSRAFLIELIIPETPEFAPSKWADLQMLMLTGGQERTAAEYRNLLGQAGFEVEQIVPTPAGLNLIISRPRV